MRVVFDANVLVSGMPASAGTMFALIEHWRSGDIQLVTSQHIIDEVRRAWTKPYWQSRLSPSQIDRALALIREEAEVTPITIEVSGVASHMEDDLVLAAAASAQVEVLVSGDTLLRAIGQFHGIDILSPPEMLYRLASEGSR
jgi:putative PIN family toxin of toxin-antitoxin system